MVKQHCLQRLLFRDREEVVRIKMKSSWAWYFLPIIFALGKLKQILSLRPGLLSEILSQISKRIELFMPGFWKQRKPRGYGQKVVCTIIWHYQNAFLYSAQDICFRHRDISPNIELLKPGKCCSYWAEEGYCGEQNAIVFGGVYRPVGEKVIN